MKRFVLILVLLTFTWSVPAYAEDDSLTGASTIGEVFGYISQYHLKKPDVNELVKNSIKGMLDTLNDPYTVYLSPEELTQFKDELNGDFEGIGVELELKDQLPHVVRVLKNTPAEQAGIQKDDYIIAVDNQQMQGLPLSEAVKKLQGKQGTKVRLTIRRAGQPDISLELTRSTVNLPTVYHELLDNEIGYIAIDSFGMETGKEFADALRELQDMGSRSLIIDLRDNGGGFVDAALEVASYILGKDKTVLYTEDREKQRETYKTEFDSLIDRLPLVVLVNGESASASEILAGALQDYGRATLIGTKTYGKGTVQDIVDLSNGGALKLTTAIYLTPKGRRIDGQGLQPDRLVVTPELQLFAAKQLLHPTKLEIKFNGDGKVVLNGQELKAANKMVNEGGKFLVPLRFTLEALGYEIKYRSESNSIVASGKGRTWQLFFSGRNSILNGVTRVLNKAVVMKNGAAYIAAEDLRNISAEVIVEGKDVIIKMEPNMT